LSLTVNYEGSEVHQEEERRLKNGIEGESMSFMQQKETYLETHLFCYFPACDAGELRQRFLVVTILAGAFCNPPFQAEI
jgi:hypothetical protein